MPHDAPRSKSRLATTAADTPSNPHGTLTSRTYLGLLVAQFLAAFNDQAIHAAAMFFAINTQFLSEENAISLMPILFYAPWALFGTIAGWLADRYSKRQALVIWKLSEIVIAIVFLAGLWLGRNGAMSIGPVLCLAAVFLMGTHSAFFVPAKYGVMPEILPPQLLSKGNGILESLSFLAVILGTVSGGVLSYLFLGQEVIIGYILLGLALIGALASLLIRKMPAANPDKPFPRWVYGPLADNLRQLLSTPALKLALYGIAFFTFVVAFMRAAVYMLGESQNPRWDELKTSLIVGCTAFGIGLGSPLAGWLSGRRIELRFVLLGAAGMISLLIAAGLNIHDIPTLIFCIVGIGFFTGFYIVPLFTLLQHKAPKTSKGDMIATSNFVNVVGAIAATMLFKLVVVAAHWTGIAPVVTESARVFVASGAVNCVEYHRGRPVYLEINTGAEIVTIGKRRPAEHSRTLQAIVDRLVSDSGREEVLEVEKSVDFRSTADVDVTKFVTDGVTHYDIVAKGQQPATDYDNRRLPRFLFFGAAAMTLLIALKLGGPIMRLQRKGL